jgi:GT2 family glycosyltransferase
MQNKLFRIIIVNYNSTQYTIESIKSVKECDKKNSTFITVVDNCSSDDPLKIKESFSDVEYIQNNTNVGFVSAINAVLKTNTLPYVVLLNPDTRVKGHFFSCIEEYLYHHPSVGIMGPRVLEEDGSVQGSARAFPTPLTSMFGRNSFLTKLFPKNSLTRKNLINFGHCSSTPIEVDWVSGACMVIRKKAIDRVGQLDDKIFMYWEDADICKRVTDAGWKVVYFPMAEIKHFTGKSSDTKPYLAIYHFHKSCYHLFAKHSKWPMTLLIPIAFLGLSIRCFLALCSQVIKNRIRKTETYPA